MSERLEGDPLWKDAILLDGPADASSVPAVDVGQDPGLPIFELMMPADICVMGLHGGAGASTVAALLGAGALDTERRWPVYAGWQRPQPVVPVVAVARTNYVGLAAANRLARLWAAEQLPSSKLIGLILIDDGPKLLKDQQLTVRRTARLLPKNGHISWQESWRVAAPTLDASPGRVRRLINQLRSLAMSMNGAPGE